MCGFFQQAERAAPVSTQYELGKVHHVGTHKALEDQMVAFVPGHGDGADDRVDALVWDVTNYS